MIKKITIDQLVPGMFVHQILEQKGALKVKSQGRVTSDDVITALKKRGVKTLAIDTDKAFNVEERESSSAAETCPTPTSTDSVKSKKVSLENELVRAEKLHKQGKAIQKLLLASVQKEMPFDASIPKAFSSKLIVFFLDVINGEYIVSPD